MTRIRQEKSVENTNKSLLPTPTPVEIPKEYKDRQLLPTIDLRVVVEKDWPRVTIQGVSLRSCPRTETTWSESVVYRN